MTPNADQIARAVIATSRITRADFEHVMKGQFSGIYGGRVAKARASVCFGLACLNDREPEAWSVWFGWHANEDRARQALAAKRAAGLLRGPLIEAVADALGVERAAPLERDNRIAAERRSAAAKKRADARAAKAAEKAEVTRKKQDSLKQIAAAEARCKQTAEAARAEIQAKAKPAPKAPKPERKKPAPAPRKAASEAEAAAALLGSIPKARNVPSESRVQGGASGPRHTHSGDGSAGNTVKRVARKTDIEVMRRSIANRPAPKPPAQPDVSSGLEPLDTAFMSPLDRRAVERCARLQKAGAGLNDIRRELRQVLDVQKSPDWIARACVTVLQDDAA